MKEQQTERTEQKPDRRPLVALIILITGIIAILSLAAGAYFLFEEPEQPPEENASFCFTLGEWEGRLAVYTGGELKPSQVLDIPLAALPEPDRQLLRDGIPLRNEEELRRAIEDFT